MQYIPNIPKETPTLYNYIKNGYNAVTGMKTIKFKDLLDISNQIAKGLQWLHSIHVAHLDLRVI